MQIGIIGSGPIGLYTAWRLVKERHDVVVYERADQIAGNVRSWGFVQLFSTLGLNLPEDAKEAVESTGHTLPDDNAFLTGYEFVTQVLDPLANLLSTSGHCTIKTGWEVKSVGRGRLLKTDAIVAAGDRRRVGTNFRLLVKRRSDNCETVATFDVVVDASGSYNYHTANRVGIGGIPAPGEGKAEELGLLHRLIPNVKGADRQLVAGRRVGVIGTGYSAITCLKGLCDLAEEGSGAPAEIVWLTRQPRGKLPYAIVENDPLPQRNKLAELGNRLASQGATVGGVSYLGQTRFRYVPSMAVAALEPVSCDSLRIILEMDEQQEGQGIQSLDLDVDIVFSLTGFHPDKELWSEIQVHTCYASDGPMKLASSLLAAKIASGGGVVSGDCLEQPAPGVETLENPEPNFFVLGMKSYGRNSTFLMRVGYEQVTLLSRKLTAAL